MELTADTRQELAERFQELCKAERRDERSIPNQSGMYSGDWLAGYHAGQADAFAKASQMLLNVRLPGV